MLTPARRSAHYKHVDPWPMFNPERLSDREAAERDRMARIAAARLELRFGPDSDIAQILGLTEATS